MTITSIIGLVGNLLFVYAAIPEVIRTIKAGKALSTPLDLIVTVLLGFVAMWSYTYLSRGWDLILTLNYCLQFSIWSVLLFYRLTKYQKESKV